MNQIQAFDYQAYYKRIKQVPCLFCLLANHQTLSSDEYYLYEDDYSSVVLDKYPTHYGYSLVFPKTHVEHVFSMDLESYLRLQTIVHKTIRAVQRALNAERVYTACLGSQLVSPHIHYHIVPIPQGLPLERQQWEALDKSNGVLELSPALFQKVAIEIRSCME